MTSNKVRVAAGLASMVALGAVVVVLQIVREQRFARTESAQQILYVSSPAVATRMALSFDALAADIYWIRSIQHYGRTRLSDRPDKRYDLLHPLLDLTTSLDPHFSTAYRFGAFFLSESAPGGADRPDLAIQLLQKAMRAKPDRWEYPHDIAFVYYRRADYKAAAEWFQRASEMPVTANWLKPMAAVTLARGGDAAASRFLWENILATSDQEWITRTAEHRLLQLDAMEQIQALQEITRRYEARTGAPPQTWEELVRSGDLREVPRDPTGTPYELNPWWGDVTIGPDSELWPLPTQMTI